MNNVTILAERDNTLVLESALLMYRSSRGDVYATTHSIDIDANSPAHKIIGAGTPMTKADLAAFARAVHLATAYEGFVPEKLLYTSSNTIAWWVPALVRNTWFKCEGKAIGTAHGPAAHPALVFVAMPGEWFVFALRSSERPMPNTPLMHSPHMNVYSDGRICTGNIDLPAVITAESISAYEVAFFRSHFTHPHHQGAVKYRGGMAALWRDQLATPSIEIMQRALLPAKETLQAAIERIVNNPRATR